MLPIRAIMPCGKYFLTTGGAHTVRFICVKKFHPKQLKNVLRLNIIGDKIIRESSPVHFLFRRVPVYSMTFPFVEAFAVTSALSFFFFFFTNSWKYSM